MPNEFLEAAFGGEALTFEQFNERLGSNADIRLINAADGSYVQRSELDAVNAQLAEAQTAAQANAEKYADFDAQLKAAKEEGENNLNAYKREVAVSRALEQAHAADEVSVRANLNLDAVTLGEDGKLAGLDEQLNALKESKPFLFKEPEKILNLGRSATGVENIGAVKGIEGAVADFYSNH